MWGYILSVFKEQKESHGLFNKLSAKPLIFQVLGQYPGISKEKLEIALMFGGSEE